MGQNKYNENETMISVLVQILLPAKWSKFKIVCFDRSDKIFLKELDQQVFKRGLKVVVTLTFLFYQD